MKFTKARLLDEFVKEKNVFLPSWVRMVKIIINKLYVIPNTVYIRDMEHLASLAEKMSKKKSAETQLSRKSRNSSQGKSRKRRVR